MTAVGAERRWSSSSNSKERFPELEDTHSSLFLTTPDERDEGVTTSRTPSPAKRPNGFRNERWQQRKDLHLVWEDRPNNVVTSGQHSRQKSLGEAFHTIRNRRASVSENAHEIAEALKAPVSYRVIVGTCE